MRLRRRRDLLQLEHVPAGWVLSFDNFWRSAIIVLQTITIDGWNESAKLAADASGIARVGPYFAILVFFGGFYVLQLFTSVMIITLSHCSDKLEEQEAEAEERSAWVYPLSGVPRSTSRRTRLESLSTGLAKPQHAGSSWRNERLA